MSIHRRRQRLVRGVYMSRVHISRILMPIVERVDVCNYTKKRRNFINRVIKEFAERDEDDGRTRTVKSMSVHVNNFLCSQHTQRTPPMNETRNWSSTLNWYQSSIGCAIIRTIGLSSVSNAGSQFNFLSFSESFRWWSHESGHSHWVSPRDCFTLVELIISFTLSSSSSRCEQNAPQRSFP